MDMKAHRFRYQGNEYVTENGLDWMDFNFRQYACPERQSKGPADRAVLECRSLGSHWWAGQLEPLCGYGE